MASTQSLVWKGEALTEKMRKAQLIGVEETMKACVVSARVNHTWQNQTATLEGSIDIHSYPREIPGGVEGKWGSADVKWALIQELGGVVVAKKAKALRFKLPNGEWVMVKSVTIPARPYLRPAADTWYPTLGTAIRRAYKFLGGDKAGGADADPG